MLQTIRPHLGHRSMIASHSSRPNTVQLHIIRTKPSTSRHIIPTKTCAVSSPIADLAAIDPTTAGILSAILKPTLSIGSLLMIVRIVMTWFPEIEGDKMPWSIAYKPTEPLLAATRRVVKPFNGLDVSPIVWVALLSFVAEILTGPQGVLSLLQRKGIY